MSTTNFLPLQAQPFLLSGAGAVIGDTSITLQSFNQINGTAIAMSDLGTIAYMTLEPGNGTNEEQISFTGVMQNTNGTATLTGVQSVAFIYPYTSTSGLSITHAGATTAILSNTSGFYNEFVNKNTDGTVNSLITFSSANIPTQDSYKAPTLDAQFAPKKYVDTVAIAGGANATTTQNGFVQIATRAQYDAGTIIGSTSAYLMPPVGILNNYLVDSGSPNVIVITPSPALASYVAGQKFSVKLLYGKTSPTVSINANGLGAKNLIFNTGTSPNAGDLTAGGVISIIYDGANFQTTAPVYAPTGTISMYGGGTAPNGYLLCNGSAVSRTTYSNLFVAIASAYGNGDGTTTFNVPNMGGRFVAGPSASLSTTLGASGGSLTTTFTPVVTGSPAGGSNQVNNVSSGSSTPLVSVAASSSTISILDPYIITNFIIKT